MTRILVIGASGGVGLHAVRQGLEAGHAVRALSRGADRIPLHDERLEKLPADATGAAAVRQALEGVDAVIHAVGVAPSLRRMLARVDVFSETTRVLVAAMQAAGVRRLVAVTGFGAGDSRAALSSVEQVPHRLLLGQAYDDKDRQEAIIRDSGLDWLIVRPTNLTNGARTGRYRVLTEPGTWRNGMISRADVAEFLLREAAAPSLSHKAPVLAY